MKRFSKEDYERRLQYAQTRIKNKGNKRGAKSKYPWQKWFSRKQTTLVQGVDFDCALQSMRVMLYDKSLTMKYFVSIGTDLDNDALILRVLGKR
jgi:hypothetical protein